ncbi:MAG TPA: hypothetical protein VFN15_01290 [Solirubrobacterales bacterium]|nr:hypothetical protein [Solirubrobacterales bacterium]
MSGLELTLAAAALLIGATGTFSPCGFSVVETLGPTGHTGGRRITVAACLAFLPGAVAGAVLTFGSLAALGELVGGAGGRAAYLAAAAIALLAAVLEVRGARIVPQIRRQLPEHWRRVMPMPLAAVLYGVLLGIGFTTFVLSFGVWALAAISLAVGDPQLGLIVGVCFGLGRALPVLVLAPLAGTPAGARATDLMAASPAAYLGMRRGDAAALGAAALALVLSTGDAGAASSVVRSAADPGATIDALVYERLGGAAGIRAGGADLALPGSDPAIGGPYVAVRQGDVTRLLDRATLASVAEVATPGADALAVSPGWLAFRAKVGSGDGIFARNISTPSAPGPVQRVASIRAPSQLSPPALDGQTLVYAAARPKGSRILQRVLGTRKRRTLARSRRALLFNPAVKGRRFAYVASRRGRSALMVRTRKGRGAGKRAFGIRRRAGVLWSTALTEGAAYVTVLRPSATDPGAEVVRVALKGKGKKGKGKRGKKRGGGRR